MPSTVGRERRREWMGSGRRRILCALCVLNLSCGSALQGRAAEGAQGGGIGSSAPTVEETGAAGDTDPSDSSPLSTAPPVSQTGTCLFGAFRDDLLVSEAPDGQYRLFPHYDTFDQPSMTPNCTERRRSNVATQALHLMNGSMGWNLARYMAGRIIDEAGTSREKQIDQIYLRAYSRKPTIEEIATGKSAIAVSTPRSTK